MQTATPSASTFAQSPAATPLNPAESRVSPLTPVPGPVRLGYRPASRTSNIDSLLKIGGPGRASAASAQAGLEPSHAANALPFEGGLDGGIFLGLRSALLFNAGLGIFAMLAYEAWAVLMH